MAPDVTVGDDGSVSAERAVPPGLKPGRNSVQLATMTAATLAEAPFEIVGPPPPPRPPLPPWLVRLLLSAGALGAGFLARAAFGKWGKSAGDRDKQRGRSVEQPDDLRAEPHTSPVEVAVEPVPDNTRTPLLGWAPPRPRHPDRSDPQGGDPVTTSIDADPMTASFFLFERQDTGQALTEALDDHDVLRPGRRRGWRPGSACAAAEDQVAVVADGLLDLDLGDLVVAGWRKQERLVAAARAPPPTPAARSGSSWPPTASARSTDPRSSCCSTTPT